MGENDTEDELTLCTYCGVGDPVRLMRREGKPDRVKATGALGCCSKGAFFLDTNSREAVGPGVGYPRLTAPEIKVGGSWRVVGWPEALRFAARNLLRLRAAHGRRAIGFYGVGQAPIESFWIAKKLFQGYLGTNHVGTNAELCLAASAGGHELVFGNEGSFTCYEDYQLADAIVLYGSNQAINHPTMFRRGFLANREAIKFVIDPRVTETVRKTLAGPGEAHHVRIKSGADVQLNLAIAHQMIARGWLADEWLAQHVEPGTLSDFTALASEARFSPAEASRRLAPCADQAGQLQAQIERMAEVWGRRGDGPGEALKVVTTSSVGINQSSGSAGVASILNLHLLSGTVGVAGAGHVRLAGQSNAPSELAMGFSSLLLPFRLSVKSRRNRVRIGHHWGIPPWMISELPGLPVTHYAHSDELKYLVTMGCDYVRNLTETDKLRGWLDSTFVVTCDPYPNPECREFADVLLPARTHGEIQGAYMNGERMLQVVQPQQQPPCDAWDDTTILVELARAVADNLLDWDQGSTVFKRTREQLLQWSWIYSDQRRWPPANPTEADVEARAREGNLDLDPNPIRAAFDYPRDAAGQVESEKVWNELREASRGLYNELRDDDGPITYARMRAGGVRWGGLRRYEPGTPGAEDDPGAIFPGRYEHDRKRATLHLPDDEHLGATRDETRYVLNTGRGVMGEGEEARNVALFNSCVKSGFDQLPVQHVITIHPSDAAALELGEGDLVELRSEAGAVVLPARISDEVIPREPFVPFQPDQNRTPLNRLVTPVKLDPIVNQPRLKRLPVELARLAEAPPADQLNETLRRLNAERAARPEAQRRGLLARLLGR